VEHSSWPSVERRPDGTLALDAGEGVTASVVRALVEGEAPPPPFTVRTLAPLPAVPPGERAITVDQTNRSVIAGEAVVVKWFPAPSRAPHPAPALLTHLAGFSRTAAPYAVIFWEDALVALVTAYLPGARDGWEWCVDEAVAGRTAFATEIGRLAAELHAAMASPSQAFPDPVRLSPVPGFAARAEEALREALSLTGGDDGDWLARHADALRGELAPLESAGRTPLIHIHGDLHVGQILQWRDGYAVVDFDGNPTVSGSEVFQPAARDLAQLLTSVDHVGQVAMRRRSTAAAATRGWVAEVRAGLERAYTDALTEAGRRDVLDRTLLRPFEVEQECRELIYAARHLERWRYAPMGVLRSWFA
jgi:maltokinase